ncbi:DUF2500 domain-containing protein [Clostridiales bacterium]|nr:DUF2500 domain-containing protein [Clostridiales bacterium]
MDFVYDESGTGFGGFGIMFFIVLALVAGVFVVILVRKISTWNKNNNSPRLTVPAKIVSKRTQVSRHSYANDSDLMTSGHGHATASYTSYYVTFQVDSGDRIEFSVKSSEYGMLAEGDTGKLSFQGSRYLSFERDKNAYTL